MVEIRYGENYEMTDLAGKSVAEAREQYKLEFGIADKAQAKLNGKGIKSKQEPERILSDEDKLSFAEKSRGGLFLMGAFLLALAITGGVFAYGWTTATITLAVTEKSDFAAVSANTTPTETVFGRATGTWPENITLFNIVTDSDYTGDVVVKVYLANAGELIGGYHHLNMLLRLSDNITGAGTSADEQSILQLLTLQNASVQFDYAYTAPYTLYVELEGGSYRAHRNTWLSGTADPLIYVEVVQAGTIP